MIVWPNVHAQGSHLTKAEGFSGTVAALPGDGARIDFLRHARAPATPAAGTALTDYSRSWIVSAVEALTVVVLSVICGMAYQQIGYGHMRDPSVFVSTGLVVALLYCTAMRSMGELAATQIATLSWAYLAWTSVFLILSFFAFALKATEALSRGAILSFYCLGFVGAAAVRVSVPRMLARYRRALPGYGCMVIGAAGSTAMADVVRSLRAGTHCSASLFTVDPGSADAQWSASVASVMRQVMHQARNDNGHIYVVGAGFTPARLNTLLAALQTVPRAVRLVPDADVENLLRFPLRHVGRTCAVELQRQPLSGSQRLIKRGLDLAVAIVLLVFLAPAMLIIALLIKLDSPGSVFFRQTRLGACGVPFRILKFRSMNVMEDGGKIVQVCRGDGRVTRLGRLLRKTSLDELPQLFNVLKGEMSLVGPRPHAVAHDELYSGLIENYELRQLVKPGITGWAQINGYRGETATTELMRKRVQYDLWYAKNANPALDVLILAKTAFVLFGRPEAY
jgi:Undecaprenyl-phosphate glucose phosphotransferase